MRAASATLLLLLALNTAETLADAKNTCTYSASKLRPITSTHTPPPYPQTTRQRHGTTHLLVTVNADGKVAAAIIDKGSGWKEDDAATLAHVKTSWRWQPFQSGCSVTKVKFNWN
jgi:TonB family protein